MMLKQIAQKKIEKMNFKDKKGYTENRLASVKIIK